MKVGALNNNNTLKYTKDKEYEANIKQYVYKDYNKEE